MVLYAVLLQKCFFPGVFSQFSLRNIFDTYQLRYYVASWLLPFVANMPELVNVNCGVERYCNAGSGEVMI
jgi:hypothetical protein